MTQARDRDRGDRNRDGGSDMNEKVVYINRVAKVSKGGRRFSFSAVVVVGDGQGNVGAAMGKAKEVPEAIRKATTLARKQMIKIPMSGGTLPHSVMAKFDAAQVLLRPASPGTGIIAGGGVRAIMEVAGVHDVLSKSLGSRNPVNVVRATMEGLKSLRVTADEKERRRAAQALPAPPPPRPRRVEPPRPREPRRVEGEDTTPRPAADATAAAPVAEVTAAPAVAVAEAPAESPVAEATPVETPVAETPAPEAAVSEAPAEAGTPTEETPGAEA